MGIGIHAVIPLRITIRNIILGVVLAMVILWLVAPSEARVMARIFLQAKVHVLVSSDPFIDIRLRDKVYPVAASAIVEHPEVLKVVRPFFWSWASLAIVLASLLQVGHWVVIRRRMHQWQQIMGNAGAMSMPVSQHARVWMGAGPSNPMPPPQNPPAATPPQVIVIPVATRDQEEHRPRSVNHVIDVEAQEIPRLGHEEPKPNGGDRS